MMSCNQKVDWSEIMGFNRLLMSDVEMGQFQDIKLVVRLCYCLHILCQKNI